MAFFASARRLGELKANGFDLANELEITHIFLSFENLAEFRKALLDQGYGVSERQNTPGLLAQRSEILTIGRMKEVVETLCRMADKYDAEYDGWDLTARLDASDADR